MIKYSETTENITVTVSPVYLDHESNVFSHKFVFAYIVNIHNNGKDIVQLMRRHWYITHNTGKVEEVEGEGVIGKQPILLPGKNHEYNSFCILESLEGFMEGTYLMKRSNDETFQIIIPRFILRAMAN